VRTTTSRIRRFFTKRNSVLTGVATLIVVFGLLFSTAPTAQAYSTAVWSEVRSTTGGGGDGRADCATGSSGEVIYEVVAEGVVYAGANTLTYTYANCATLTAAGTSIGAYQRAVGPYGSARSYGPASQTCYIAPYAYAVIGAIVYKTPGGYVSGIALKCGLLPTGAYYTTTGVLGWSSSTFENVDCPANQVAVGLFVGHGGILDKFGLRCGPVSGVSQASVTVTSTTGTFGSTLALSTSGGSGSGAVTYQVTSAGTAGCSRL
jgi:hypothetical protein